MGKLQSAVKAVVEYVLPWAVLLLLVVYTYAKFFRHNYGILWLSDGRVSSVLVNEREPTLHPGDRLIQVGPIPFEAFSRDLRQDLFGGARPGDTLPVVVEREGQVLTVEWRVPGPNHGEFRDQLWSQWFLAYFFWMAGTASLLLLRPKDMRWLLLGAFDLLTAIWLMAGSGLSSFHIWYSALVLRAGIWLAAPVYLHLHWIFPKPLGRLPRWLWASMYAAGGGLALAQWFQLLYPDLYFLAFLLSLAGSLALLVAHAFRQPEMRRELIVLTAAAALAVTPSLVLSTLGSLHVTVTRAATLSQLSFPILPFAYLYAAYRRQLGGLELRVNRLISMYIFLILLGSVVAPILVAVNSLPIYSPDQPLITSVITSILATALALWSYPLVREFIERRVLGISVPSRELHQRYSAHITSSSSFSGLTRLLDQEVMPSLLVRQFVFLMLDNDSSRVLLSRGLSEAQVPGETAGAVLTPLVGRRSLRGVLRDERYAWIRLILALKVQDELVGLWLFGRRDPDDVYSNAEVPVLQLFADQAAVALSNIRQSERLRALYQADIDRQENERISLARELHDSVLSELAGMLMNTDIKSLPRGFQEGYRELTERLRQIVSELRPPMLSYGLKPAIEELADNMMERSHDAVTITVDLTTEGERYPVDKEQHLFRIAQEACENAVRHSRCRNIAISGRLDPDCVELSIADDGDGFELTQDDMQLYDLLSHHHFGLAGMLERARVIGADIHVDSTPGAGARIRLRWLPNRLGGEAPQQ